jgi:DNA-directed RNA polymerase specialized sigma24 family protein
LLIAAIAICFFRINNLLVRKQEVDSRVEDLLGVQGSLNALLQESLQVSNHITQKIENVRSLSEEALNAFEKEKKALTRLAQELKLEAKSLREEMGKYDILTGKIMKDKYSEAIRLSETGLNAEEIAKKTNIPLGEIELALSLRR